MNSNAMIKTSGYQINDNVYSTFTTGVEHYGGTTDGRLYWIERNDVDLAGIQIKDEVLIPRQMIVQESYQPRIYGQRLYENKLLHGQVQNIEIHDIFSTVKLSNNTIDLMVGSITNVASSQNNYFGLPVSMEPTVLIGTTDQTNFGGDLLISDYRDTEQIVACRSRKWLADLSGFLERDFTIGGTAGTMNAQVAQIPMRNIFDSSGGSGDAVASNYLYHVRIMISTIDRTNDYNGFPASSGATGWFIAIPPSIQYLTADVEKPSFLEQMTMIRRSRAI